MGYELEAVSASEWKVIQDQSDILRRRSVLMEPRERAINRANGNFLIEVGGENYREEWIRRCVLVSSTRSLLVNFSNMSTTTGKLSVLWSPLSGIPAPEISSTSLTSYDVAEAAKVLFKIRDDQFVVHFAAADFG